MLTQTARTIVAVSITFILAFALALAVIMRNITAVGLVIDIFGAILLAWDEMTHVATYIRDASNAQPASDFADLRWYMRFPFWVAKTYGPSEHAIVTEEHPVTKSFSVKFWALLLIIIGFIFQWIGSF